MDPKMTKGERAMEAVAVERFKWLNASTDYVKAINHALQSEGAHPQSVNALIQSLECKPFSSADEYDADALCAVNGAQFSGSPLESKLLRLAETCAVCGGVFPEELFERE